MGNSKRKKDRKKEEQLKQNAMSMERFLSKVLGISDEELMRAHLTHQDIKKMFPNVRRASIAQVLDDPSLVSRGEVIYVRDSAQNSLPYINDRTRYLDEAPTSIGSELSSVMDDEEWNESVTWDKNNRPKAPEVRYEELDSMSVYELVCLAKIYHESGQLSNKEIVLNVLRSRSDSKQGNKRSREKALRKELKRNKNEEY